MLVDFSGNKLFKKGSGGCHLLRRRRVSQRGTCPHCGRGNRLLESHWAFEFFDAYFVPILPMGTVRAVLRCPTCLGFYSFAPRGKRLKKAVAERREIAHARKGEDIEATLEAIEAMAHLGDFEGVESFLQVLSKNGGAVFPLAQAHFFELQGVVAQAETCFRQAVALGEFSGAARFWLGRFLLNQKRDAEAIDQLRLAAQHSSRYQYLDLLEDLVELRRRQKNWDGLAIIMTEILRFMPTLANSKAFSKLLAKARRKSRHLNFR